MIKLSPTKLNLFQECKKCFWLQENKRIHRPRFIFPSLPGGMDLLIKKYFDKWREKGQLPPEIAGKVSEKPLQDIELLRKWRYWGTGPKYEDKNKGFVLQGALDECFVDPSISSGQVYYIPVDYKTRGFDLKEDSLKYYQLQLDCYTLILKAEGYKVKNFAYLVYYIPKKVKEKGKVDFSVEIHKVKTNPESALKIAEIAVKVILGPQPRSHSQCTYCSWGNDFVR